MAYGDENFLHLFKANRNDFYYVIAWHSSSMNTLLDSSERGKKNTGIWTLIKKSVDLEMSQTPLSPG